MISKHVAYEAAHDDYGALARYIVDAGHDGEKCLAKCALNHPYGRQKAAPTGEWERLFFGGAAFQKRTRSP